MQIAVGILGERLLECAGSGRYTLTRNQIRHAIHSLWNTRRSAGALRGEKNVCDPRCIRLAGYYLSVAFFDFAKEKARLGVSWEKIYEVRSLGTFWKPEWSSLGGIHQNQEICSMCTASRAHRRKNRFHERMRWTRWREVDNERKYALWRVQTTIERNRTCSRAQKFLDELAIEGRKREINGRGAELLERSFFSGYISSIIKNMRVQEAKRNALYYTYDSKDL